MVSCCIRALFSFPFREGMKILHYIATYAPAWGFGGPVRSVSGLCKSLVEAGHEVDVMTTTAGLEADFVFAYPTIREGVRIFYHKTEAGIGICSAELEKAVRKSICNYDIVHVTGIWQRTSVAACRAASREGVPYVISPRGALGAYSWKAKRLKKTLYYWLAERKNILGASGVHYTSRLEADESRKYCPCQVETIIPNSTDFSFWGKDALAGARWRASVGIGDGVPVALYTGRVHHKKNLDFLFPVLRMLPEWVFVVVGFDEGGETARWLGRACEAGVRDQILVFPQAGREGLRAVYSAASVFVLPSHHENFANSVIEAVVCECPVLVSETVGVGEELVKLGMASVLPLEVDVWVNALRSVQKKHDALVGQRERLKVLFSENSVAEKMVEFYQKVLLFSSK